MQIITRRGQLRLKIDIDNKARGITGKGPWSPAAVAEIVCKRVARKVE